MGDILVDSASHNTMRQPSHPPNRQLHVIAKILNRCQRQQNLLSARSGILTQDQWSGTVIAILELDKSRLELIIFLKDKDKNRCILAACVPENSPIKAKTKTNYIKADHATLPLSLKIRSACIIPLCMPPPSVNTNALPAMLPQFKPPAQHPLSTEQRS